MSSTVRKFPRTAVPTELNVRTLCMSTTLYSSARQQPPSMMPVVASGLWIAKR